MLTVAERPWPFRIFPCKARSILCSSWSALFHESGLVRSIGIRRPLLDEWAVDRVQAPCCTHVSRADRAPSVIFSSPWNSYPAVDSIVEGSKSCIRHVETLPVALSRTASFVEAGSFGSVLLMVHMLAGVRRTE